MVGYIIIGILVLLLLMSCAVSWAEAREAEMYVNKYYKLIIAEAADQGYEGMYAVACVVRNRLSMGMDDGLCSKNRPDLDKFVKDQGVSITLQAKHICDRVFNRCGYDSTKGATHFENVEKYGMPSWRKDVRMTVKIGDHTFFKRR